MSPTSTACNSEGSKRTFIPSIVYGGSKRTFHSKHRVRGQQENLSFQASCTGAAREPFIPSIVYGGSKRTFIPSIVYGGSKRTFIPSIVYGGSKRTKHRVRGQQENLHSKHRVRGYGARWTSTFPWVRFATLITSTLRKCYLNGQHRINVYLFVFFL